MYNKPVKEKGIKKESEDGEPVVEEIPTFIENAEQYDNFTKHPDTVKIFTTDESYVGESTFSGIFVNAVPEKTKYMGQVAKTVVLGQHSKVFFDSCFDAIFVTDWFAFP